MQHLFRSLTRTGFLFLALITASGTAYAQFDEIGAFLRAGSEDATVLTREYLRPFPTGFGTGLNSGFTETAQPKKLFGFSLQIRSSVAFVPDGDQSFDITSLNLQRITVAPGENAITPTIAGDDVSGPRLEIRDPQTNQVLTDFVMPQGTGFSIVPAPTIQASVGLIKNTDLTIRYAPEIGIGEYGNFSIIGGAIKHDVKQWIPGAKLLPVDISVLVGFNRISLNAENLGVNPDAGSQPVDPQDPGNFDDQQISTSTNTFLMNAYVGKSLPFISVYGGVGYQRATFDVDIEGDYPVALPANQYEVISDPVSFSIDSDANIHALAGFRFKLGFFAIYGEALFSDYVTANAGIGFSFR